MSVACSGGRVFVCNRVVVSRACSEGDVYSEVGQHMINILQFLLP